MGSLETLSRFETVFLLYWYLSWSCGLLSCLDLGLVLYCLGLVPRRGICQDSRIQYNKKYAYRGTPLAGYKRRLHECWITNKRYKK